MNLVIVSATLNAKRTVQFWASWRQRAKNPPPVVWVEGVMGPVQAFFRGISEAITLHDPDIIACLHDDLEILEDGWDELVRGAFDFSRCLLAGFGGARGLGSDDIYKTPYRLEQLARRDFMSNMRDAEAHGIRRTEPARVACLDGFSQIGRPDFLLKSFAKFDRLGVKHHFYDSWLGALAWRGGGEVWYLPIRCHHAGGFTAVGDSRFGDWTEKFGGEGAVRDYAHQKGYEDLRGTLPLYIP